MKSLSLIAAIVLAVAAAVSWVGLNGAKKRLGNLETEYAALTNKVQTLTTSVLEKDATIETLRTGAKLDAEDKMMLSNRIAGFELDLTHARVAIREKESLLGSSRSEVQKALEDVQLLKNRILTLEADLTAARSQSVSLEGLLAEARTELARASAARNASERHRNDLLRQWSDLASIRAQYKSLANPRFGPSPALFTKTRPVLALEEDGTLTATPRE